jgi:hypothetical protein
MLGAWAPFASLDGRAVRESGRRAGARRRRPRNLREVKSISYALTSPAPRQLQSRRGMFNGVPSSLQLVQN